MRFKIILIAIFSTVFAYLAYSLFEPFARIGALAGIAVLGLSFAAVIWVPLSLWQKDAEATCARDVIILHSAYGAMGVISFLLVFSVLKDLVSLLSGSHLHTREGTAAVMSAAVIGSLLGWINARYRVKILRTEITLPRLPAALDGFKIAQISDLHIGSTIKGAFVERVVELVNGSGADLAVLTGDIVDGWFQELESEAEILKKIRLPLGGFYVTGNHEYYWEPSRWIPKFTEMGFNVLHNRGMPIEKNGAKLWISGVPDLAAPGAGFEKPNADLARGTASVEWIKILLCHQPSFAPRAEAAGFDLMISGHTHGGQFFPWTLFAKYLMPFAFGLRQFKNLQVYTSRGTGYWGPPVRLGAPAEVSLLVLRSAH